MSKIKEYMDELRAQEAAGTQTYKLYDECLYTEAAFTAKTLSMAKAPYTLEVPKQYADSLNLPIVTLNDVIGRLKS